MQDTLKTSRQITLPNESCPNPHPFIILHPAQDCDKMHGNSSQAIEMVLGDVVALEMTSNGRVASCHVLSPTSLYKMEVLHPLWSNEVVIPPTGIFRYPQLSIIIDMREHSQLC